MYRANDGTWSWSTSARRFRKPDGKFVSQSTIKKMKNDIVDADKRIVSSHATRAVDGDITIDAFVRLMRAQLKQSTVLEYMLGRGGRNAMTQADHGRVGNMLRQQYAYLNKFAADIADGKLTADQATTRASMYVDTARSAYERGQSAAWDVVLPVYPGVHTNCQCSWSIAEHGTGESREVRAYWRVNSSQPCQTCLDYRSEYNPLRIPRPVTV